MNSLVGPPPFSFWQLPLVLLLPPYFYPEPDLVEPSHVQRRSNRSFPPLPPHFSYSLRSSFISRSSLLGSVALFSSPKHKDPTFKGKYTVAFFLPLFQDTITLLSKIRSFFLSMFFWHVSAFRFHHAFLCTRGRFAPECFPKTSFKAFLGGLYPLVAQFSPYIYVGLRTANSRLPFGSSEFLPLHDSLTAPYQTFPFPTLPPGPSWRRTHLPFFGFGGT